MTTAPTPPTPDWLDRAAYTLDFEETFAGPHLDSDRWVDHYLPHWTTPDRSAARYRLGPTGLQLRIEADQPAWLPEDGELRVSNLQTGTTSGPLGSSRGPMIYREGLTIRTPQRDRRLYAPAEGLVEATLRASADPTVMLAFWLVGFGHPQHDRGELCVAELFGDAVLPNQARVNTGVKAHQDPRLRDDMTTLTLDLDATQPHTYAVAWNAIQARFYVDDRLVRTVDQGMNYPLFLLVDLFEFPAGPERDPATYPKTAEVLTVRGHRHR